MRVFGLGFRHTLAETSHPPFFLSHTWICDLHRIPFFMASLSMYKHIYTPKQNFTSLTRLEEAEEAHAQYLQRILTDDPYIAGAVMIGYRPNTASSSSSSSSSAASHNSGQMGTTTSGSQHHHHNSTPSRRRVRRSEGSSTSNMGGTGSSTTGAVGGSGTAAVGSTMVSGVDPASGRTGVGTSSSPHAILPSPSAGPPPSSTQTERFWNRSRRDDSVIL